MGRKSTFRFHNANGRIRLEISADEEDFNGMTVKFEKPDEVKESEDEEEEEDESLIMTGLERITKRQRINIEVPTRSESTERRMKIRKLWRTHTPVDVDDPPTIVDFSGDSWDDNVEDHGEGEKEEQKENEKMEEKEELKEKGKKENDEDEKEEQKERKERKKERKKKLPAKEIITSPIARRTRGRLAKKTKTKKNK